MGQLGEGCESLGPWGLAFGVALYTQYIFYIYTPILCGQYTQFWCGYMSVPTPGMSRDGVRCILVLRGMEQLDADLPAKIWGAKAVRAGERGVNLGCWRGLLAFPFTSAAIKGRALLP